MKAVETIKNLPGKLRRQLKMTLVMTCAVATFAVPAFSGGYTILRDETISSSAASVDDVELLLVGASAFQEAKKSMTASGSTVTNSADVILRDQFIENVGNLVGGGRWQNIGLLIGPTEALSGSNWGAAQSPPSMGSTELQNYNNDTITTAFDKYSAFGNAIQRLNRQGQKSKSSTVSLEEGLDSMSLAALKLGNFGVEFLRKYNPAPVVVGFYSYRTMVNNYSDNELVKIVTGNTIMNQIIYLFGDTVGNTGLSFFLILNAVFAVAGLGISMLFSLFGTQTMGEGIRKFIIKIVVGSVGLYLISNTMAIFLNYVGNSVLSIDAIENISYIENNLNLYDWYLTGFSLPSTDANGNPMRLTIGSDGQFELNAAQIKAINEYTYKRLTGNPGSAEEIRERMENYADSGNLVATSFVTPVFESTRDEDGSSGEARATDVYYAYMENLANNEPLTYGNDDESSPLYGKHYFSIYNSRYLYMSYLNMYTSDNGKTWTVTMYGGNNYNIYGVNPISAFNMLRTEFKNTMGFKNISAQSITHPELSCVVFDAVRVYDASNEGSNMNSVLRFIAIFTIVMAALKGMITIFTAGFGGIFAGSVKTATGSAHGLGQAIGGIIAIFGGLIGISLILSVTMTLLDAFYGIAYDLLNSSEILDTILTPITDAVGDIPFIGSLITSVCEGIVGFILTLIMSLTFPKLGGIPINIFCQAMADLPGKIGERAQMLEGQLLSGRTGAHGGGMPRGGHAGGGRYGAMATQQMAQAGAAGTRQAAAVISGLATAAKSIGGAGLSALGGAVNKKADTMDGKPENPGMDNWDDMTPEEQLAAAAIAADDPDAWNAKSQEEKENAVKERLEQENASEASKGGSENDPPEQEDGLGNSSYGPPENPGLDEGVWASMTPEQQQAAEAFAAGYEGWDNLSNEQKMEALANDVGFQAATEANDMGYDTGSWEDLSDEQKEAAKAVADKTENWESMNDASKMEAINNDEAFQKASEGNPGTGYGLSGQEWNSMTPSERGAVKGLAESTPNWNSMTPAQKRAAIAGVGITPGRGRSGSGGSSGANGKDGASAGTSGKSVNNASATVNNTQQVTAPTQINSSTTNTGSAGDATAPTPGAGMNGTDMAPTGEAGGAAPMPQGGMGADGRPIGANAGAGSVGAEQMPVPPIQDPGAPMAGQEQEPLQGQTQEQAREAAEKDVQPLGTADQAGDQAKDQAPAGRDGTAKSAWGKDMSLKDQRRSRFMHAVGDGLQAAGGNRSLGDGLKGAMGGLKDAAVSYVVPEEYMQGNLIGTIRSKRKEQEEKRKRGQQ